MGKTITIDPVTRLEGLGKIHITLDDAGTVTRTRLQAPDFRGFEKFCEGRAAEEMPTLTPKICGVCPTAHHLASVKALDHMFGAVPPATARNIRELMHAAFIFEDHLLHFYVLGGPDWLVGPGASVQNRNVFGAADTLGSENIRRFVEIRRRVRDLQAAICGSPLYPVCGLPGGVSKPVSEEIRNTARTVARDAVAFAEATLMLFHEHVLDNKRYAGVLTAEPFTCRTGSMGMVDENGRVNFYDGHLRVVDPDGKRIAEFPAADYETHFQENVEAGTYQKVIFLKQSGWKGYVEGAGSGIIRVGPLGRLNAASGMATPRAQAEYERWATAYGCLPVHHVFAYHWARLIEVTYAAERMVELAEDPSITEPSIRHMPDRDPDEGVGAVEAPRGTLIHHYTADSEGMLTSVNMLVATQFNAAAITLSLEKAARAVLADGNHSDLRLNLVETVFRAYDPCMACATH